MMNKVSTLVSTKWLADTLYSGSRSTLRVLDSTWYIKSEERDARKEFAEGHLPQSQYFDIDECSDKKSLYGHMLPCASQFSSYVGDMGISNNTHVIIYDTNEQYGMFSAQRAWWMFRVFGHHSVSILNGGSAKWRNESLPWTKDISTFKKEVFEARFERTLVKSFEEIKQNIIEKQFQVVDARAAGRFDGTAAEPRPGMKSGHIPGSLNIPFKNILDTETRTVKGKAELQEMFSLAGVDLDNPLVGSCGSGVTACCIALAAFICDKKDVAVYDGSWTEWSRRSA